MQRIRRLGVALLMMAAAPVWAAGPPQGKGSHADLVSLFADYESWQRRAAPGYTRTAVNSRLDDLKSFQVRLADMNVASWSRTEQADWLAVRAQMDALEYAHRVTRPWARDPGFHLASIQAIAFADLAASPALQAQLATVPETLAQARAVISMDISDVASDHATLALRQLEQSDGVEDGYPYRASPPPGVIGWYKDLRSRAATTRPELLPAIDGAIAALEGYRDWLRVELPRMTARAGVGEASLDWYLKNVLLMPWSSKEVAALSQRELDRLWGFWTLERHRNRELPEIAIAKTDADYMKRMAETDARVRKFMVTGDFMSIPPEVPKDWRKFSVPPTYSEPFNVPFITRATPPNYWEQVQFRDPSPDHLHAVIPGHRMDLLLNGKHPNPIRARINDGARWQGWAVYLEESALTAGFFDDRPRVRELIYLFGLWRAARSLGDVWNQWNAKTAGEVAEYWQAVTPMMDADVARKYAHIRTLPGHGIEYTMGNFQMWKLLADKRRLEGERFDLKAFHDDFIRRGRIPLSLIRYEMTGLDDEVSQFWDREPMPAE